MPNDAGQIAQDVVEEGGKVSQQVFEGIGETIGATGAQLTGKKPKDPQQQVEKLRKREEEFKKEAINQVLARLRAMQQEEARLRQKREQEKKDWSVLQTEKMAGPELKQPEKQKPKVLPQVAKQRGETRVGWGAG